MEATVFKFPSALEFVLIEWCNTNNDNVNEVEKMIFDVSTTDQKERNMLITSIDSLVALSAKLLLLCDGKTRTVIGDTINKLADLIGQLLNDDKNEY